MNGEMVIGKCYYFITHAYHNYLGRLVKIHGPGRYAIEEVSKIHSCSRNWTRFFAEGAGSDTKYDSIPNKPYIVAFDVTEWPHDLPERKSK